MICIANFRIAQTLHPPPHNIHTMSTPSNPLILISPQILQRIQNDIDKDLEFKKVPLPSDKRD